MEMALEAMTAPFPLPRELPLPGGGGNPDVVSLDQGLGTLLTGQGRRQGSPAGPGLHI